MSFGCRLDWCAFCAVRSWLHVTSGLLYQLWIELRMSTGSFRSWFSHWRSFHQAGLLNACWVPRDTWSVFKGKQLNHEKSETACTEALLLWRDLAVSCAKLAWQFGCLVHCICFIPIETCVMVFLAFPVLRKTSWWFLNALGMNCLTLLRPGRKTSRGCQTEPACCFPLLLKLPWWRYPLRESRKSINK